MPWKEGNNIVIIIPKVHGLPVFSLDVPYIIYICRPIPAFQFGLLQIETNMKDD